MGIPFSRYTSTPELQHPTPQTLNPLGFRIMAMAADVADPPGARDQVTVAAFSDFRDPKLDAKMPIWGGLKLQAF